MQKCKEKSQQKQQKPPVPIENFVEQVAMNVEACDPDDQVSIEKEEFTSLSVKEVDTQPHISGLQHRAQTGESQGTSVTQAFANAKVYQQDARNMVDEAWTLIDKQMNKFDIELSQELCDKVTKRHKENLKRMNQEALAYVDEIQPPDEADLAQTTDKDPLYVFNRRIQSKQEKKEKKEVTEKEKLIFCNDGTLKEWLEKVVKHNDIQILPRVVGQQQLALKDDYVAKAETMRSKVMAGLIQLSYEPSHSQFACAITAVMLFSQHKRVMLTIPPGKGKSRVICAIAALFQRQVKSVKRIFVCFSSDILHQTDKKVYSDLNLFLDIEIVPIVGLEKTVHDMTSQDLLILDEADHHLFDDVCKRKAQLPKCKGIIGLTATSFQVNGGVEYEYLKRQSFTLIDSGIPDTTHDQQLTPVDLPSFFTNSRDRPLLVFCGKGRENEIIQIARENCSAHVALNDLSREILTNCRDMATLRALTRQVLIISDLELVRGVDYRSVDERGLELLITHSLPSKRELKQLKGRVGRYGEVCARYYLDSLTEENLVDKQNELTIAGHISQT